MLMSKPAAAARSKWRMSEDAHPRPGLIGPNAILQLLPVIERWGGASSVAQMLADADLAGAPGGTGMIPEVDAARLHRQLRHTASDHAPRLAAEAGIRTADYILAHRIPKAVQFGLRALPARAAAGMLSGAIRRHAWTFAGSGRFHVLDPWMFEITDNPLIRGETSGTCLCHWHASVFERLYQSLVSPRSRCQEVICGAMKGQGACRFQLWRQG